MPTRPEHEATRPEQEVDLKKVNDFEFISRMKNSGKFSRFKKK